MPPNKALQVLCVSIHDVAPHTWKQCERWLDAIHAVADIPVSLLVVPHYHRYPVREPALYECLLEERLARGDELVLHGYTHLDEGPTRFGWLDKFVRHVYTRDEGEFYAIDADEARARIELGLKWFEARRWPVTGFVAPAWLLGEGAWDALRDFPFSYTTTLRRLFLLPERRAIASPCMVYSVGNRWRRSFSYTRNLLLEGLAFPAPMVRLALHPNDVNYPGVVRRSQALLERMLVSHQAMTKRAFVESVATQAVRIAF